MKRQSFWLILILIFVLTTLSCSTSRFTRQDKETVVARVNGQEILLERLQKTLEEPEYYSTSPEEDLEKIRAALDEIIVNVIVKQKARSMDLSEDTLFQQVREKEMKKFLLGLLFKHEIAENVVVTDQEIELYYQEHPYEFYQVPDKARAKRILIEIDAHPDSPEYPQEEEKALLEISQIRQRIINGEDFSKLAKELSDDRRTGKKGGSMGTVSRRFIIPEFEDFIFSANLNELSQPIRSPQGWNLLIVQEKTVGEKMELDENARNKTRDYLKEQKQQQRAVEYVIDLKQRTDFLFNEYVLSSPDSLISDNPWVLVVNQEDTIFYNYYQDHLKRFKREFMVDTVALHFKKELLMDAPRVINPLLRRNAKEKGYLKHPEYLEAERTYAFSWAEAKIRADLEKEMQAYKPKEEEVYEYYLAHRENYATDSSMHVYHILFQDSLSAQRVREEILNGADFVEMAEKHHSRMSPEGDRSYDLGFISDQMMPKEFYIAAALLQVGEISQPIKTEYGYHLIKLVERERSLLDSYKTGIRIKLSQLKAQQIKQMWEGKLREESDIWIDENVLRKIKLKENKETESSS